MLSAAEPHHLVPLTERDGPITFAVHARLREAILSLELEPGQRISQLELTRMLDVSRTPLREALRLLEREGLIEPSTPHSLVTISPITMDDLEDLYARRVTGEGIAMWLTVPQLDAKDCDALARELRTMATSATSRADSRAAHRRFHEGLRVGAGERMQRELQQLFEHAERYQVAFTRKRKTRAQEEHRAILRACREADRVRAAELLIDHCAATAYGLMKVEAPDRGSPSLDLAVRMAHTGLR
jgi:DNA-binding GntR family transcriptional regulator